jgi:hypothetical protein
MNSESINHMVNRISWLSIAVALLILAGCSATRKVMPVADESGSNATGKIQVEAYLFDAVLKRDGKTTSFRLEMYATDTIVALAGRGYLGKGALRGLMHSRSIQVYFPTSNEFVDEPYASLLSRSECRLELSSFDPVRLMFASPDSLTVDSEIRLVENNRSDKRREYSISSHCDWSLSLAYDLRPGGWRPVELSYDDGHGTSLRASRREYQPRAKVKPSRFDFSFPPDASRLEP